MDNTFDFIKDELEELKAKELFRSLRTVQSYPSEWITIDGVNLLNLSSNNYLGLAGDCRVKKAAAAALEAYGLGATASRLVAGNYELYNQLEQEIAAFKGTEAALVFNSGYAANIGVIPALVGRQDVIISDRLNHASIIDGIILSRAERFRFDHRDMVSLEKILMNIDPGRKKLIVTDTVFSMDGDLAPLKEIVALKEKYGAILMLDEAHGGGIFGDTGKGLAEAAGVSDAVDINMGTLGKAFGGVGAYIAGKKILIDYLINKSRSLIYSTGLPPAVVGGLLESLKIVREEPWRRENFLKKADTFRRELKRNGFNVLDSESHIIPVVIGSSQKTVEFSKRLWAEKLYVAAIRPPTVPVNTARLRISLMATHKSEDLKMAMEKFVQIGHELQII